MDGAMWKWDGGMNFHICIGEGEPNRAYQLSLLYVSLDEIIIVEAREIMGIETQGTNLSVVVATTYTPLDFDPPEKNIMGTPLNFKITLLY